MSLSPHKLVIIDDDDGVRLSLMTYFDILGYDVFDYVGAESYLADDMPIPDCLILDLELRGMNGIVTLQCLADAGRLGPTIILSGTQRQDLLSAAHSSPAQQVLRKPIEPDLLYDQIIALTH